MNASSVHNAGVDYKGIDGGKGGTFTTGPDGKAFIITDGIRDTTNTANWHGIIFGKDDQKPDEGYIYSGGSKTYELTEPIEIPEGKTLVNTSDFIIGDKGELTNKGTILNNGTLETEGTGTIGNSDKGEIHNNGSISNLPAEVEVKTVATCISGKSEIPDTYVALADGESIPLDALKQQYHSIEGWYDNPNCTGEPVTTITKPTTVYAKWKENIIICVSQPDSLIGTYGVPIEPYDLYSLLAPDSYHTGIKFSLHFFTNTTIEFDDLNLSIESDQIIAKPGTVTVGDLVIRIEGENCEEAFAEIPLKYFPKDLTVSPRADQYLGDGETPLFDYTGEVNGEKPAFSGKLYADPATGYITPGDLALVDKTPFNSHNYTLIVTPGVRFTRWEPSPVIYTVIIPETEGATISPSPGTYYYEEGERFFLSLSLDSAYNLSTPVVSVYGQPVQPYPDGRYPIDVYSDISISIEGVTPNLPVAIDPAAFTKSRVYASDGVLHIEIPCPSDVMIFTAGGAVAGRQSLPPGNNLLRGLPEGLYIVRLSDGTAWKVRIVR